MAVRALGSTGCLIELPDVSSPSAESEERFELDRNRVVVAWLSARYRGPFPTRREEMLPR